MTEHAATRPSWIADALVALVVFLAALLPRAAQLDVFLTPDELRWTCRSTNFHRAIREGNLAETYQTEHPGVITMWLGGLGLPVDGDSAWSAACRDLPPSKIVGLTSPETLDTIRERLFDGRARIALFVSLGIAVFYLLAARLFDRRIALLATVVVLLDPLFLANARVLHLDAVTTTLMTVSLLALLVYLVRRPQSRYLVLSAIVGGLAALNKAPAMFLAPIVVLAVIAIGWRRDVGVRAMIRAIAVWGAVALATYVAAWPAMWVAPLSAVSGVVGGALGYAAEPHEGSNYFWGAIRPDPGPAFYPVSWWFRTTPLVGLGLLVAVVRLALGRDREEDRIAAAALLAYAVLFALFMTTGQKKFDRYLLPAYPSLVLVASLGLGSMVRWLAGRASERVRDARVVPAVWAAALGAVALAQLALVAPHRPYYLSYYNPLAGGADAARWAMLVGWGEGIDQPARHLNERPDAEDLKVATRYRSAFGPLFAGRTLEMDDYDPANLDYYLLYVNQVQRDLDPGLIDRLHQADAGPKPEVVARHAGIDYAWLYANDNYEAPMALVAEQGRDGDAIVVRGDSLFAKHYDGPLPVVPIEADAPASELLPALEDALARHDRVWYVRYDDIYPRPGLAQADYELATKTFTIAEHAFPEVDVRLLTTDAAPSLGGTVAIEPVTVDGGPVDVVFGSGELSLEGIGFTSEPILWGRELGVTLSWSAADDLDRDLTAFLHLVGPGGRRWAQSDKPVTDASLVPTSQWPPGMSATDRHHLGVPAGTPPGTYELLLGVYDARTGDRVPVRVDGVEQPGGTVSLDVQVGRSPIEPDAGAFGLDVVSPQALSDSLQMVGLAAVDVVEGGGTAPLTVVWHALDAPATDHGVALHVHDAKDDLVGTARFPELAPGAPTSAWAPGDWVRGWYDVPLDGRALAGMGSVSVELLDERGRPALEGTQAASVPLEIAGPVRRFEAPNVGDPVGASIGDRVRLVSATVGDTGDTGDIGDIGDLGDGADGDGADGTDGAGGLRRLPVTLVWRALDTIDVPYTAFVHLVREDGGAVVAQVDAQPVDGARPTTSWLPGEYLTDAVEIDVSADVPSGTYTVRAGMYDPATVRNLPVRLEDGSAPPDARVTLATVEIAD